MRPQAAPLAHLRLLVSPPTRTSFAWAAAGPSRLPQSPSRAVRQMSTTHLLSRRFDSPAPRPPLSVVPSSVSQLSRRILRRARFAPLLAALPVTAAVPDAPDLSAWYQPMSDALVSVPLPLGLTIILLTFALRGALTFPATYLVRRQAEAGQRLVKADVLAWVTERKDAWMRQAKQEKLGAEEFIQRIGTYVKPYHQESVKRYRPHPLMSALVPMSINVPLLVMLSIVVRNALAPGSPAALESFWLIDHLGEPDRLLSTIGFVLGFATSQLIYFMPRPKPLELDPAAIYTSGSRGPSAGAIGPGVRSLREKERGAGDQRRMLSTTNTPCAAPPSTRVSTKPPPPAPSASARPLAPGPSDSKPSTKLPWYRRSSPLSDENRGLTYMWMQLGGTVVYAWISCYAPAGLALYWLSSMAFTFCQTAFFFARAHRVARDKALT